MPRLAACAVLFLVAVTAAPAALHTNTRHGFTLALPDGWSVDGSATAPLWTLSQPVLPAHTVVIKVSRRATPLGWSTIEELRQADAWALRRRYDGVKLGPVTAAARGTTRLTRYEVAYSKGGAPHRLVSTTFDVAGPGSAHTGVLVEISGPVSADDARVVEAIVDGLRLVPIARAAPAAPADCAPAAVRARAEAAVCCRIRAQLRAAIAAYKQDRGRRSVDVSPDFIKQLVRDSYLLAMPRDPGSAAEMPRYASRDDGVSVECPAHPDDGCAPLDLAPCGASAVADATAALDDPKTRLVALEVLGAVGPAAAPRAAALAERLAGLEPTERDLEWVLTTHALARIGAQPPLLKMLGADERSRAGAARALAAMTARSTAATRALVRALQDRSPDVAREALRGLLPVDGSKPIELIAALQDPDADVRRAAERGFALECDGQRRRLAAALAQARQMGLPVAALGDEGQRVLVEAGLLPAPLRCWRAPDPSTSYHLTDPGADTPACRAHR